jgi:hypothetical protein
MQYQYLYITYMNIVKYKSHPGLIFSDGSGDENGVS